MRASLGATGVLNGYSIPGLASIDRVFFTDTQPETREREQCQSENKIPSRFGAAPVQRVATAASASGSHSSYLHTDEISHHLSELADELKIQSRRIDYLVRLKSATPFCNSERAWF